MLRNLFFYSPVDPADQPPYPYTHGPLHSWDEIDCKEETVTLGMGVLAQGGEVVIVASDKRVIRPGSSVKPHDEAGKQWQLWPFPCCACAAGSLSISQELVDEVWRHFVRLSNVKRRKPIYTGDIAKAIDRARYTVFRRRVDWSMKEKYGMSLKQWQSRRLSGRIFSAGELLLKDERRNFNTELIAAGFLGNHQLVFYRASRMQHLEADTTPGVYVIGSGAVAALDHLNFRGQNLDCSLARSLLHMTEAARVSKEMNPDTVGSPSDFWVVRKNGTMKRFDPECRLMKDWEKSYKNRPNTWSLQNSKIAAGEVEHQMLEHEARQ